MAENKKLVVEYSKQSLQNAKEIVTYLNRKFSEREVLKFYQALNGFEKIICAYPTLYAESSKNGIRRAVLNKALSVYYLTYKNKISIVAIFDNRWDEAKRLK